MRWAYVILLPLCMILLSSCNVDDLLKTSEPPEVSDISCNKPDFFVQPLDTAKFWITAKNPQDGVLTYEWSANGGDYIGSRQKDSLTWRAPVTGGSYNISVTVANAEESVTRTRRITVPSLQAPFVEITAPYNNDFVVQNNEVEVVAFATSENGIFQTQFYVNDSLITSQSGNSSNQYSFDWFVQQSAGPAELKIVAIARVTGTEGQDAINVNIEGVVPGKTNGKK